MKKQTATAAAALLMICATPARAEFLTGNQLFDSCTSRESIMQMDCLGYVSGVHDALAGITICLPSGVTRGQIMDFVTQWLRANPAQRHLTADQTVSIALNAQWPCKRAPDPQRNSTPGRSL